MLAAASFAACADEAPLQAWGDKPTPALEAKTITGEAVSLAALRGKVVVINFWASWCDPCKAEMPSLARLAARMKGRPLTVVTVNYAESREKIDAFLAKTKLALPVIADRTGDAADAWGVGGMPMTFVVDKAGRARYRTMGERNWDGRETVERLEQLLAEKPRA